MPESKIILTFNGASDQIVNWEHYSFASSFLIPADAFTFVVGDEQLSPELRNLLLVGTKVSLSIDPGDGSKRPLASGFIDQLSTETSASGTFLTIRGRDILGNLCDAQIDPWSSTFKFTEGQTLGDVFGTVFQQFGINAVWTTDAVNRSALTGINVKTAKVSTQTVQVQVLVPGSELSTNGPQYTSSTETIKVYSDPTAPVDLIAMKTKKLEPLQDETCFQFIDKLAKRFHLNIWAMTDGSGVVISAPDYDQAPLYNIVNRLDGVNNNVIRGNIAQDYVHQPSLIIAKGMQGGGDANNVRMMACVVNELIGYLDTSTPLAPVSEVISRFKGLVPQPPRTDLILSYAPYFDPPGLARPVYLEDKHSKTIDQLIGFLRRKLSEHQRQALKLNYTVQDHQQNGIPYKHNTIATVNDESRGIRGNFWIESVSFRKGNFGTLTDLSLIPVGTLLL